MQDVKEIIEAAWDQTEGFKGDPEKIKHELDRLGLPLAAYSSYRCLAKTKGPFRKPKDIFKFLKNIDKHFRSDKRKDPVCSSNRSLQRAK